MTNKSNNLFNNNKKTLSVAVAYRKGVVGVAYFAGDETVFNSTVMGDSESQMNVAHLVAMADAITNAKKLGMNALIIIHSTQGAKRSAGVIASWAKGYLVDGVTKCTPNLQRAAKALENVMIDAGVNNVAYKIMSNMDDAYMSQYVWGELNKIVPPTKKEENINADEELNGSVQ